MIVVTNKGGMFKSYAIDLHTTYEGLCRVHLTDEQAEELNVIGFIYVPLDEVLMVLND